MFLDIIVVTDGIVDFPDVNVLDMLLSQLRTHTISVSFIRVAYSGQNSLISSDLGYLCNVDLMEFIAKTTIGAYVEYQPHLVRERETAYRGVRVLVSVGSLCVVAVAVSSRYGSCNLNHHLLELTRWKRVPTHVCVCVYCRQSRINVHDFSVESLAMIQKCDQVPLDNSSSHENVFTVEILKNSKLLK